MKKAIAYLRFSTSSQQYGDSLRRQNKLVAEWLDSHPNYLLDDLTYKDLGLSAFDGSHAVHGAFSEFMEAVQGGYIPHGTVLLVESLDRLSREKIGEATERLRSILSAGIDVVTLTDHTHYTKDSLDDPYSLIKAILIAQRANEESEIKSRRMKSAWQKKREDAEASGRIITRSCPRWLRVSHDGKSFELIAEHAATLQEIFRLRLEGNSINGITKMLNDRNVVTLTGEAGRWNPSTVEKLLSNKALTGVYVPSYRTIANGIQEIPGYFPRVIADKTFSAVRGFRSRPYGKDKETNNPWLINLFRSVMTCKACGHSIMLNGIDARGMGYYVCPMRRLHRCDAPALRRDIADANLIRTVLAVVDKFQPGRTVKVPVRILQDQNILILKSIDQLVEALQVAPEVTALAERIKALHREFKSNEVTMHALKSRERLATVNDISLLNLALKTDREKCRRFVMRNFRDIRLDTASKTCDILFSNGFRLLNFPLLKSTDPGQLVSALAYTDDETLVL